MLSISMFKLTAMTGGICADDSRQSSPRELPACPWRGECGRGRVGDVLDVTIKLFLLLVRQLKETKINH